MGLHHRCQFRDFCQHFVGVFIDMLKRSAEIPKQTPQVTPYGVQEQARTFFYNHTVPMELKRVLAFEKFVAKFRFG